MEEPGRLQSMGSLRVGHAWATSHSLFTFMHWRRKWQPTPIFLPRESQGRGSLVGCRLWGHTESDRTEVPSLCLLWRNVCLVLWQHGYLYFSCFNNFLFYQSPWCGSEHYLFLVLQISCGNCTFHTSSCLSSPVPMLLLHRFSHVQICATP